MDRASARRRPVRGTQRCLRYGVDEASERLARVLLGDPRSRYVPVGLLDDHPGHHRLRPAGYAGCWTGRWR